MGMAMQKESEIDALLNIISDLKPRYLLEIGNWQGQTLQKFGKVASSDAVLIGVDIRKVPPFKTDGNQRLHLIKGDSQAPKTLRKLQNVLQKNKLDFLFIDGDHMTVAKD